MKLNQNWNLLSDFVRKTMDRLEKQGASDAEAFFMKTENTEIAIRNSELLTQNKVDDAGVGFRVVVPGGKVAFACTNSITEKAVMEAGERALSTANAGVEIPNFAFPEERKRPRVDGLFDSDAAEIGLDQVVDIAKRAIDAAESFDRRVIAKDGRVVFMSGQRGVVNTLGVDFEEKETKTVLYLGACGQDAGQATGICSDFMFSREAELAPEEIGENAAKRAVEMFNPRPLRSFQGTVIFGPEAVSGQIVDVLVDALKGENAATGRSRWSKAIGNKVASSDVTIVDDAKLGGGFASRSFDDEGCSSQTTNLINKGEFESFLHDATTANSLRTENTGNASRFPGGFQMVRMIIGTGYRAKPEVYPSNLIIRSGNKAKEDLISETRKGVLVESMAGFVQSGSGVISAQLSNAFYIENGEIQNPVKDGMVSGIAFDWLNSISGIGNDSKRFQNSIVPSIRVENVKVIGS